MSWSMGTKWPKEKKKKKVFDCNEKYSHHQSSEVETYKNQKPITSD
jgi:hypothetical protein